MYSEKETDNPDYAYIPVFCVIKLGARQDGK